VVHPTGGGSRRWDRTWKIYDHTGVIVQVMVEADESRDPAVDLKVGRNTVGEAVPPWIARRRQGLPALAAGADAEERECFYAALWQAAPTQIILEVEQSRSAIGYLGR
jgi:hypothetical protein